IVCEVPEGFGSLDEFHRLIVELPDWAAGLPLAAKVWTRQRYAKATTAPDKPANLALEESTVPTIIPTVSSEINDDDDEDPDITDAIETFPLADLVTEPLTGNLMCCPFHEDRTPSLRIYPDHFHCFGCGAHGTQIDWLVRAEGMEQEEAI